MTVMFDEKKFHALPESTQRLLEFMSIIYAPIAATPLSKLSPVAMDVELLRPLLDELVKAKLLTVNKSNYYACKESIRDELTRRSILAGRFAALAKVVDIHLTPDQPKQVRYGQQIWSVVDAALRDLRLAVLLGKDKDLPPLLQRATQQYQNSPKFSHTRGFSCGAVRWMQRGCHCCQTVLFCN